VRSLAQGNQGKGGVILRRYLEQLRKSEEWVRANSLKGNRESESGFIKKEDTQKEVWNEKKRESYFSESNYATSKGYT